MLHCYIATVAFSLERNFPIHCQSAVILPFFLCRPLLSLAHGQSDIYFNQSWNGFTKKQAASFHNHPQTTSPHECSTMQQQQVVRNLRIYTSSLEPLLQLCGITCPTLTTCHGFLHYKPVLLFLVGMRCFTTRSSVVIISSCCCVRMRTARNSK